MSSENIKGLVSKYFKYVLLAALMYMPIFGSLNTLPIRIWDEARITVNACEMFFNGELIVTHYDGTPDMWNTKPPMLVWMQVLLMKVMGINELSIRLPSAFAAFFTCLAFLVISIRYFNSFWLGFITILVLLTTEGYVKTHAIRTGDYDSLLTMFTTLSCLYFFVFTESGKQKHLYLFFLMLTCAALTKGIASLLFTPALFLYVLIRKQLPLFLKNKHFYIGVAGFLFIAVGYYLLRESRNPGYLQIISENELGGRYLVSQGNQPYDEFFYFDLIKQSMMADRYLLIPCGVVIGLCSLNLKLRRFVLFTSLAMFSFFLIVSFGQTRLEQYVIPALPFFAFTIALFIYYLFDLLYTLKPGRIAESPRALPFLLLFLLFASPYQKVYARTYEPVEEWSSHVEFYALSRFYRDALNGKHDLNNVHLVYEGYDAQFMFYMYALKAEGVNSWKRHWTQMEPGLKLIVSQDEIRNKVREKFTYIEKNHKEGITTYTLTGLK